MEVLIFRKINFLATGFTRRLLRMTVAMGVISLTGCGAMWDTMYPPEDPRDVLTFHLASLTPYADWALRTGPLGDPQVYVQPAALFTAASIEMAAPMVDGSQQYFVGVKLEPQATRRLASATQGAGKPQSLAYKPVMSVNPTSGQATGIWEGYIALLQQSKLVTVMPLDQPILGGTFAIPVPNAAAAQDLSNALDASSY